MEMKLKELFEEKLGEARKHSEETRRKISEANKGRNHSDETKMKISKANTGKRHSQKTRRKMSILSRGKNNPMSKYTLWDNEKCSYNKVNQRDPSKPYRSFITKYNSKPIPIGNNLDFLTCEIIHDLIDEEVKKNVIKRTDG